MSSYSNGHGTAILPPTTQKVITGASIVHRQLDKRQRAILAADVLDGMVTFTPSAKQLADIFDVSTPYIAAARKLSPGKRAAILRDWDPTSFADLVHSQQRQLRVPNCASITNSYLETVIRAVGVDRTLEVAIGVERS
jgi:hypothetical protein